MSTLKATATTTTTTTTTTFNTSLLALAPLMADSDARLMSGSLGRIFTMLALTYVKQDALTSLECAKIQGWQKDVAPARSADAKSPEGKAAERAKERRAESVFLNGAMAYVPKPLTARLDELNALALSGASVEKQHDLISEITGEVQYFNSVTLEKPAQVMDWIEGFIPQDKLAELRNKSKTKGKAGKARAATVTETETTASTVTETSAETPTTASTDPLKTSKGAAVELAKTALMDIAAKYDLVAELAQAETKSSLVESMAVLAAAFDAKIEALNKAHEVALKIATKPAPRKTTAKKLATA